MRGDVLDLTLLQKRGLLKIKKEYNKQTAVVNKEGYEDLTQSVKANVDVSSGPLSFLDGLAGVSNSIAEIKQNSDNIDLKDLRVKIEDIEYKLEKLIERLVKMEEKFS